MKKARKLTAVLLSLVMLLAQMGVVLSVSRGVKSEKT